ncbi:MAG: bifunctional [glutamate--ammonia ligase]-adenylyl-L-tyrosine phosphorylase/[glutamate--ammonia-ligase] adenylyltransferase [Proteobacteria bacterium]|nr:bifunctional [glutamate--ammonia ligase]-adenylyl-L-tyrosine phosphorylase/[glutamate--ammonia-ligase] adenylyltransferase [Pseudomonadota bacterium]MCL2307802.1 bifunctional [glutamate--ammonia ligase]-adenylyl-L-tyrosine phosphorylase/[glutamate--ammonia-ligase] adenylyltransferase [Pseudomonadota bacterium]
MNLSQALSFSAYAQRTVAARPEYRDAWETAPENPLDWDAAVTRPIAAALTSGDADGLATTLRRVRQRVMLHTMARDLTGIADLDEVCGNMGRLATDALIAAVTLHQAQLAETRGWPRGETSGDTQPFVTVGMGKLGGDELNVSSDIDLVFLYPEEGETDGARPLSNHEFFVRLGQRVIAALDEVTADGFVFRVDMRLRPYGESAPLAVSFDALEHYLTAQGRMWERYAWLKAQPLTGSHHDDLHQLIAPFVYRKYLDFDAYEGLRDVREQIRTQGKTRGYAHNIKLGSGGIRDIEFIAQALQIVRGGRLPVLQLRGTRAALRALGERGLLPNDAVDELLTAYDFLRRVEHRLQYRDDLATQTLPDDEASRTALAHSMNFASLAAFQEALDAHRQSVVHRFETLLGYDALSSALAVPTRPTSTDTGFSWENPEASAVLRQTLAARQFADPDAIAERIVRTRESKRYAALPERSRQRFDALTQQLIDIASVSTSAATTTNTIDTLFLRLFTLLETISRRSAYLALLSEHPQTLPTLARLLAASSWAADYLNRHPILLDELLSPRILLAEPDWLAWRDELTQLLDAHSGDTERQMDELRHFQHAQTFRLLAQDLAGQLTVERLADHLTALADLILEMALAHCWRTLMPEDTPPPRFAIIGYGKLGSKEMSYGSDLDLVFLYEVGDDGDEAVARYTRLAQRMNTWLTSTTAAGHLYTTDLRLRPDGSSGLLVSRWDAFVRYQREKAWTFEHQALTRARFIAGDSELGAAFMRERAALLQQPRNIETLRRDIIAMRERMSEERPNPSALFDVKHGRGGMVDIEFIVQFLVLAHAHRFPTLTRNTGNVALLTAAATLGLITGAEADAAIRAYRLYRRQQHAAQLQEADSAIIASSLMENERNAVRALWDRLLENKTL